MKTKNIKSYAEDLFEKYNEGSEKLKFLKKSNTFLKSHAEQSINFN